MELKVLECPYCRGSVKIDPESGTGVCANCGKSVISKSYGDVQDRVKEDRRSAYEKVVLARGILESRDGQVGRDGTLRAIVDSALVLDPTNADVWYLNAAVTMLETGKWDGTSDNMVSKAKGFEAERRARYFTYEDCMNVKKEVEQAYRKASKGMTGIFLMVGVFMAVFFLGIPLALYLAGILPMFALLIIAGVFTLFLLMVFLGIRLGTSNS